MRIWVDADACPGVIREILYRAAERVWVPLVLVANQPLTTPRRTPPEPRTQDGAALAGQGPRLV